MVAVTVKVHVNALTDLTDRHLPLARGDRLA
jgi:hypothetical protein